MEKVITEIQIVPIKPKDGLVGFASFTLFGCIYCSSVGICTKVKGNFRLIYPTKKVGDKSISIFYPIKKNVGKDIEEEVIEKYTDLMKTNNDRYYMSDL